MNLIQFENNFTGEELVIPVKFIKSRIMKGDSPVRTYNLEIEIGGEMIEGYGTLFFEDNNPVTPSLRL